MLKNRYLISSNRYLQQIKKRYQFNKIGFAGTLDPFAKGTLICASGQYTKLMRFLHKAPKHYIATIWLGTTSLSLDIQNITAIKNHKILSLSDIVKEITYLRDKRYLKYTPPAFSAKHINGKRAYQLAKERQEVALAQTTMEIFDLTLKYYKHPFISLEISVSEGSYIRSFAQILLKRLQACGTLSYLNRVQEGGFVFDDERSLDVLAHLNIVTNEFLGSNKQILLGKPLDIQQFTHQQNGSYVITFDKYLSVITIKGDQVVYEVNGIERC